jgi:hypothetical protein
MYLALTVLSEDPLYRQTLIESSELSSYHFGRHRLVKVTDIKKRFAYLLFLTLCSLIVTLPFPNTFSRFPLHD